MSHCRIFHYDIVTPIDVREIKTNADYLYDQLGGVADDVTDDIDFQETLEWYLDDIPFQIKQDNKGAVYAIISKQNVKKLCEKIRKDWNKRIAIHKSAFDKLKDFINTGVFTKEVDISYYHSRNALEDRFGFYFYHNDDYARTEECFLIEFLAKFAEENKPLYIIASFDYHY